MYSIDTSNTRCVKMYRGDILNVLQKTLCIWYLNRGFNFLSKKQRKADNPILKVPHSAIFICIRHMQDGFCIFSWSIFFFFWFYYDLSISKSLYIDNSICSQSHISIFFFCFVFGNISYNFLRMFHIFFIL